ncbi:Tat pathway signal protein [Tabrizicola piscis]|uniref:Tat pathway signal protein n=1 Tax=Tabrizicola piscis TaxID=2494374 RepID=A0A3S8U7J3_9RHOB|nr:Tat pathway signal protein [Tabrizicola piscis]AZL59538.1 Tat pathway signal protein [Tabrizicola piscis]
MNRRTLLTAVGTAVVLGAAGYWRQAREADLYVTTAAGARVPLNLAATGPERLAELVRMAALAPNSHNTQAWRFTAVPGGVHIAVDPARRTPVVDPDDHHLFVSLGAAVETLIIAATAYGTTARPEIAADGTVTLIFAEGVAASPLLPAIRIRQSHRGLYDGSALTEADRVALKADPTLRLIEDAPTRTALRDLTVAAYGAQMADTAYRAELKSWLRFSQGAALESRDGLFSGCSGSPALPQMLGESLFGVLVTAKGQSEALAAQIDSTPALAFLVSDPDTPAGRIDTGRRLARICLAATAQGLAMAHINPAIESPDSRAEVARICGVTSGRPSILLRLGRTLDLMPYSLRRPSAQTLLT